jgi:hypothetical protein
VTPTLVCTVRVFLAVTLSHQLASREVLLPVGVSLGVAGVLLRGFARSNRQSAALRRQHWLHNRKPGEPDSSEQHTGWLDKHLSIIANIVTIIGAVVTLLSFFRL